MSLALTVPLHPTATAEDLAAHVVERVIEAGYVRAGFYVERGGVLRCLEQRGYAHVHDGIPPGVGVLGRVHATGEPVVLNDAQEPGTGYLAVGGPPLAEMCVPLRRHGVVVGVLNIEGLGAFTPTDVLSVMIFADAIDQALDAMQVQRPHNPWESVSRAVTELSAVHDPLRVLELVADRAPEVVQMRSALVRRIVAGEATTITAGPDAAALEALPSETLDEISGWTDGKVSVTTQPGLPLPAITTRTALDAWIAVPLPDGHPHDLLLVVGDDRTRCSSEAIQVLELFTRTAAQVLRRCETSAQLVHSARLDTVTGLEHASSFDEALSAIDSAVLTGGVALLVIDVDNLHQVNEQYGHAEGDERLRSIARRLSSAIREGDRLFRIGGDEFGVIARCGTVRAAASLAHRLRRAARSTDMTVSIGVTVSGPRDQAERPSTLVVQADLAMKQAKRMGRDRIEFFAPELQAEALERAQLTADLNQAMVNGELRMVYQPIVNAKTHRVAGAEALMRWTHPTRGPISPGVFIPVAEASGAIVKMGLWAIRQVLEQGERWDVARTGVRLSVNVAGQQLTADFVAEVGRMLDASPVPPGLLVIELTESGLVDDEDRILQIAALRQLGVTVAIDDFGTGYSSLSYLRRLPIDVLKIDRSFVHELSDARNAAVARTIIELTKVLSLDCVAEGIETSEQVELLAELGCQIIQGFHFARPMEAEEIPDFIMRFEGREVTLPV